VSLGSLEIVAVAEGVVATSTMAAISGHFVHARRRTRREVSRRTLELNHLRSAALGATEVGPSAAELSRLPVRLQVALLADGPTSVAPSAALRRWLSTSVRLETSRRVRRRAWTK